MDSNWASEQLQTIRTLMERSAIYRRALAPIMLYVGATGIIAGIIGWKLQIETNRGFILFWGCTALVALAGSFLLVRRQSLKDSEAFWSPPTRRVAEALLPPLCIGFFINCLAVYNSNRSSTDADSPLIFITLWLWFYGCAAHSAGFFMTRGIKLFGWILIVLGCLLLCGEIASIQFLAATVHWWDITTNAHLMMGGIFGGLHLIYGIYLYLTEKGKNAA